MERSGSINYDEELDCLKFIAKSMNEYQEEMDKRIKSLNILVSQLSGSIHFWITPDQCVLMFAIVRKEEDRKALFQKGAEVWMMEFSKLTFDDGKIFFQGEPTEFLKTCDTVAVATMLGLAGK